MKTKKMLTILFLVSCLMFWAGQFAMAGPMGTAFTYQGRLIDANEAADGLYDFQFKLFDANSDGNKLGLDVNKPGVDVIDGYFTVELDFGGVYDGNERWLDIGVRPGDQNDPNVYTVLSPRQKITPTPYAMYALGGGGAGGSAWQVSSSNIYYNNGNVGIGTNNPHGLLQVGEPFIVTAPDTLYPGDKGEDVGISDSTSPEYTPNAKLEITTGTSKDFLMISSEPNANGDVLIVKHNGNVGIGTSTPAAKLEVAGEVKITGGSPGVGKVLTSNLSGLATWQTPYTGDNDWTISGYDMYSGVSGNVGIGTSTPDAKLTVEGGTIKATNSLEYSVAIYGETTADESAAIYGLATGSDSDGVSGESDSGTGVYGWSSYGYGVEGESDYGTGVSGESVEGDGVRGESSYGGNGVHGVSSSVGVYGESSGEGAGVYGESSSNAGVCGWSSSVHGVRGESSSGDGVYGESSTGNGVHGESISGYAGRFDGDVLINGEMSSPGDLTASGAHFGGWVHAGGVDVEGDVHAYAYYIGDIIFQKDGQKLWRMFEDEDGVYLENLNTGKIYSFVLQEAESNLKKGDTGNFERTIRGLQSENESLKERIEVLERAMQRISLAETKEVQQ